MEIELTPKGQTYRGISRAIRVIVFAVVVVSIIVLARIVFVFFGQLKNLPGYQFVIDFSETLMGPFKAVGTVKTPYEGIFDIGATVLLMLLILGEFILSGIGGYFSRRARSEVIMDEKPQMPSVQVVVSPTIGSNVGEGLSPTPDSTPVTPEPVATQADSEPAADAGADSEPEKVEAD